MVASFAFGSSSLTQTQTKERQRISWIFPYGVSSRGGGDVVCFGFWITSLHDFSGYASALVFRHVSSRNGTMSLILFLPSYIKFASSQGFFSYIQQ